LYYTKNKIIITISYYQNLLLTSLKVIECSNKQHYYLTSTFTRPVC